SEPVPYRMPPFLRRPLAALVPRSLRGRLLLALVLLTALMLLALDAVVYSALNGYLQDRTDTTLRAVRRRVVKQVRNAQPAAEGLLASARMLGTSAYFLQIRHPDGTRQPLAPGLRNPADPPPALPDLLGALLVHPGTVPASEAGGPDYRVLAG